ncbi:vitamin K epoxide reductase family protein [Ornithinimicrobium sufpigmenti]|uniref:vitamin K epoxide reductase family protein n=1 Tax=Ornithinimicrobium sufpigmenti TaxID=2508882 RepID=UPI001035F12D|nr:MULTISPECIES: vitamin K epoxide reductase family protein [unclassified Ornithinimicrobium]
MQLSTAEPGELTAPPQEHGGPVAPAVGWVLLVCGWVGLSAAFVLLVEKIRLVADPGYVPSCSISPLLSCGSVMSTAQAEVFGFPNPILGVAGFAALVTVAVTILSGARLPSWYWVGLTVGTGLGAVFVHWLIFQSVYRIGALCPYCMVVWVVTVAAFVAVLARWSRAGALPRWVADYATSLVVAWVLVIAALIGVQFWEYWVTLI